jgi:hypothetical protein
VNEKLIPFSRVPGGDDNRLAIDDETHMADEAFVEDAEDLFMIITASLGQPL